jgi:crotonobetainyl-CoA:carnitine CoA-transferase CaiB-like acyl-CoA transferase
LAGIRVLDFGWALVGSITGKYLGDHGAEVIRVESTTRPDMTRVDRRYSKSSLTSLDDKPWFAHVNSSKRSLCIDLKNPRSRMVIDGLIAWADVVNENFTPGTLDRLGYTLAHMRQINPAIIVVSGSLFGQTGPLAREWGIDGTGAAISGRLSLTGWPDRTPVTPTSGIFGDYVVPYVNAIAVVASLINRIRSGEGRAIDASMFEVTSQQITPALLDYQSNGRIQSRSGNRALHAAPHGVFPSRGDDEWVAIAVTSDEEWSSFRLALGEPRWASAAELQTLAGRKAAEDVLEAHIAVWTAGLTKYEATQILQSAGVPAGPVLMPGEVVDEDPQLREREFLRLVEHEILGPFGHQVPPFKLSATPAQPRPAPAMGADNEYICKQLLGMNDEAYLDLLVNDVFS